MSESNETEREIKSFMEMNRAKKENSEIHTNTLVCPKAYAEDVAKYVSWLKAVSD